MTAKKLKQLRAATHTLYEGVTSLLNGRQRMLIIKGVLNVEPTVQVNAQ